MSELHYEMAAFHDELLKQGAPVAQIARGILSRVAPAIAKAAPKSALEAAHMGVRGARSVGEMVGGGISSVGGAIKATPKAIGDFAKRQVHGFTGWAPKTGPISGRHGQTALESIGFQGSKASKKALVAAKAADPKAGGTGILQRIMHGQEAGTKGLSEKVKARAVSRAEKFHEASKAHERLGLTSLSGWAKGMATRPVETMRAGIGREWHSGKMGKAMVGLPLASAAHSLVSKPEAGQVHVGRGMDSRAAEAAAQAGGKAPGRLERAGKALGEGAWAMGMPILPAIAAAKGISTVAGGVGRLAGRLTGRQKTAGAVRGRFAGSQKKKPELGKHPAPPDISAGGQTQPSERIMTPAAQGKPPEDVIS